MSATSRILAGLVSGALLGLLLAWSDPALGVQVANIVQPFGKLWLNALQMTVVPLVLSLVIVGVNTASDAASSGRVARRAIIVFLLILAGAAAYTAIVAPAVLSLVTPDPDLAHALSGAAGATTTGAAPASWADSLTAMVPSNAIAAAAESAMLPLVVFALFFGFALTRIDPLQRERMVGFFQAIADAMIVVVRWVLWAAPFGVFALILAVCARAGIGMISALGVYILLECLLYRFFRELTQSLATEAGANSPVPRWLAMTTELFGQRTSEAVAPGQAVTVPALVQATEGALKERIGELGAAVKTWLLAHVDDPQHRLYGAQKTLGYFQAHCRTLLDQLRDVRRRLAQETGTLEQYLVSLPADWKKALAQCKKTQSPDPEQAFLQFCRFRLQDFGAVLAGKIIQALQSVLSGTNDLLVELNRELQFFVSVFDDSEESGAPPAAGQLLGQLRKLVADQLRTGAIEQALQLDQQLTASLLTPHGGLLQALIGGGEARTRLLSQLEHDSRHLVLQQLETLDIAAVLAEGAAIDPQLAADWCTLVNQAQPRWQGATAERRLLCVLPERSQAARDPQVWQKSFQAANFRALPTLIDAPGADLLLCFDVGPLTATDILAQLLVERPDFAEVAGRLHTRADVSWPEIVVK